MMMIVVTTNLMFQNLPSQWNQCMVLTFQYTRQYQQLRLQEKGKSGIGGIKQLRSGLTDLFCSASVELSNLALKVLTLWQKSRNRDDITFRSSETKVAQ
jgi:hypothetical protein